uniref:Uncharacterized protein n=1 Tax=Anguilla anguilla TaxID=7936 RepID=A0A0E9RV94_ANGAN
MWTCMNFAGCYKPSGFKSTCSVWLIFC